LFPPKAETLAFSSISEAEKEVKSKKWLKRLLKGNGWPKEFLEEDSRKMKIEGIRKLATLSVLTKDDWQYLPIPIGIKLLIEQALNGIEIGIGLNGLTINKDDHQIEDRIVVKSGTDTTFEIDRHCPHKGADLTNVMRYI
jgi:hypothetical protein